MAGNVDPQNVRILTMNMCHKKGEELGMVVIWDKIGVELANAGLFNWEELKRATQKGVKDALMRVVGSNAMKGFLDELIDMLGISEFKAAQVGPAAAGKKRASKTDRTYEAARIVEPPAHDTIEVTRQFFVDHGIEGLPLGNGIEIAARAWRQRRRPWRVLPLRVARQEKKQCERVVNEACQV